LKGGKKWFMWSTPANPIGSIIARDVWVPAQVEQRIGKNHFQSVELAPFALARRNRSLGSLGGTTAYSGIPAPRNPSE
jgi:hypothetical protein